MSGVSTHGGGQLDLTVLDLFSAAAGGWSLGMHRAGFRTVAACEWIDWRRALYAENNPGVPIYDDVRTLTADRLRADLGTLPRYVFGSPPCQDISSANTKGKGVDGERSGLYFEAIRIIGETSPRGFALENSANLRTRGADRVLGELEGLGYACWTHVVGGDDLGANHERKRSWIIGLDLEQLTDPAQVRRSPWAGDLESERRFIHGSVAGYGPDHGAASHAEEDGCRSRVPGRRFGPTDQPEQQTRGDDVHAAGLGHEGWRARRYGADGDGSPSASGGAGEPSYADQAGQADGRMVAGLRQAEITLDGRGAGRSADGEGAGEMGLCAADRAAALRHRPDWSLNDLAHHLRVDDGLSAWVAGTRVAVGGPRGTSAASLIVEAFGDAVIPQIPEAIGRAILRTEAALAAIYGQATA